MVNHNIWRKLNPWYQEPSGETFSDHTGPQRVYGNPHVRISRDPENGEAIDMVCFDTYISSVDQSEPLRGELERIHSECDAAAML